MLTIDEIKQFMLDDMGSEKKHQAIVGQRYYEADHDIKDYRFFYFNEDEELVEDTTRSNVKIAHPFLTELVDQATQHIFSGEEGFVRSDKPELQKELNSYFNDSEDFLSEISELVTGGQAKGFEYMYAYKDENDRLAFECVDSIGVIEVRAKDTDSGTDNVIYHYVDRIEKGRKAIVRIEVWDKDGTWFYVRDGEGEIMVDPEAELNPRPHALYKDKKETLYEKSFGYIPFWRFDNNKKQTSLLKTVKALIDDYDLMASSLSNNLVDFDNPVYVLRGYEGENAGTIIQNLKTKRTMGLEDTGAGLDVVTIDVPYEARKVKLELDEVAIYRFGMGLNTAGLKDTSATTSIAIKSAYALLDLRCSKLIIKLKQFMRKLLKPVLAEINEKNGTAYEQSDVYFRFEPETMVNEAENAQVALTEAQTRQAEINTLLSLATQLGDELLIQLICDELELDYTEIKSKLPDPNEAENALTEAQGVLNNIPAEGA